MWYKANVRQTGFYRVVYQEEDWNNLKKVLLNRPQVPKCNIFFSTSTKIINQTQTNKQQANRVRLCFRHNEQNYHVTSLDLFRKGCLRTFPTRTSNIEVINFHVPQTLSPEDRANIIDDMFSLSRAGFLCYGRAFMTLTYLRYGKENSWLPWACLLKHLVFIKNALSSDEYDLRNFKVRTYVFIRFDVISQVNSYMSYIYMS